ncbi:hypothetical protein [Streptomyces sp. OE57]
MSTGTILLNRWTGWSAGEHWGAAPLRDPLGRRTEGTVGARASTTPSV